MYALSRAVVLLGLVHNVVVFEVPSKFGCKNSLISDEWRRMVLNFHNEHRRRVAEGKQGTKGGRMPAAKDMNELTWDCNIEHQAWMQSCEDKPKLPPNPPPAPPVAPYARLVKPFKMGGKCNIDSITNDTLKAWWDEAKTVNLKQTVEFKPKIKNFAQMVNAAAKGFACTYNKCGSGGKFVCMYDSSRNANQYKQLYDGGATCTCQGCTKFLCQPAYKLSTETEPKPITDDGLTYDQEMLALDMNNYYRRLLATGWAEDSKGLREMGFEDASSASVKKLLVEFQTYYVNGAQHAKAQGDCANTNYVPDNGNSLNYFKGSYEDTNEQVLEKAIKSWWSQLKGVDVPDNGELNNDIVTKAPFFANMAHEEATKVGCSVVNCASKGYAVAICEYNSIAPQDGDPLYTVGKTCSKCDKRECEPAGGLCST